MGRHAAQPAPDRAPRPAAPRAVREIAYSAVAVAGVLAIVGTLLLWNGGDSTGDPTVSRRSLPTAATSDSGGAAADPAVPPASAPPASAPASAGQATAARLPLTVLNNSTVSGLATTAADRFRKGGWPIRTVGNVRGRFAATTVYYAPGQEASARALARQFPAITRVHPRFEGLPGTGLTVVVTRYFPH